MGGIIHCFSVFPYVAMTCSSSRVLCDNLPKTVNLSTNPFASLHFFPVSNLSTCWHILLKFCLHNNIRDEYFRFSNGQIIQFLIKLFPLFSNWENDFLPLIPGLNFLTKLQINNVNHLWSEQVSFLDFYSVMRILPVKCFDIGWMISVFYSHKISKLYS